MGRSAKTLKKSSIAERSPNSKATSSQPSKSVKDQWAESRRKRRRSHKSALMKSDTDMLKDKVNVIRPDVKNKAFCDFDIDERLLKAIGGLGWQKPTQVQEALFPLALEDKSVIARARTGSGKTGAYLVPIINKVVNSVPSISEQLSGPSALFIAPTKELCVQIYSLLVKLIQPFPFLQSLNLAELSTAERPVWENDYANFVVSTPGKLLEVLLVRSNFCNDVRHLVLDEADLLLSFGYEEEMSCIKKYLPERYQCILTSATITDDMSHLKALFVTGPVFTIKLKEGDLPDVDQLSHYLITCSDDHERFSLLVAMLKLRLIIGKTIIFVNDTNRCYMTSLLLRAFGLKSCILNSSMPANSRFYVIDQYNRDICDIVIASDPFDTFGDDGDQSKKLSRQDKEAGVSRGIDFHHVGTVVNLDFPTSTDMYIHRVGRTARGRNKGTALSFCTLKETVYLDAVRKDIDEQLGKSVMIPYEIRIKELDSFVLRVKEVLSKCGKSVIKAARMQEIKLEMMRSTKLQSFFASNPREKILMETSSRPTMVAVHTSAIADVPEYMVPISLRGSNYSVNIKKRMKPGQRRRRKLLRRSSNQQAFKRKKNDPLSSFVI